MNVLYIGDFGGPSGYGRAATDYIEALHRAGVHVRIQPGTADPVPPKRYGHLNGFVGAREEPDVVVIHAPPHVAINIAQALPPDQRKVAVTTWETDRMPRGMVEMLGACVNRIVVPSTYCAQALQAGGMHEDLVHVIPHAIDAAWWRGGVLRGVQTGHEPYTFVSVLTWCERKNPIGLLKAYLTSFTDQDNVKLRVVCPSLARGEVTELVDRIGRTDLPAVEFLGVQPHRLSDEKLRLLYHTADCYVSAARSEGWGLGAFEAAAIGLPIVVPGYSGWQDWNTAATIPYCETPAFVPLTLSDTLLPNGTRAIVHNTHEGIDGTQMWCEPDLHALSDVMVAMYKNRVTKQSPPTFAPYSHQVVGAQFGAVLEALL